MATTDMTKIETKADAIAILGEFKSNMFLAEIEEKPELSEDGRITNIETFIKHKNKPDFRSGSNNPVHQLYAVAPKAVSVILEAIDEMNAEPAEKRVLFDVYIAKIKDVADVDEMLLDQALAAFSKAYKGEELEGPKGCR